MRRHYLLSMALCLALASPAGAQRFYENLDRGLVAVKVSRAVYCSWRVLGEEYYNVKYNLYRDGVKVNSEPLSASNYTDASGSTSSTYTVRAVVGGIEQPASSPVQVLGTPYIEIPKPKRVSVGDGKTDITDKFEPNDATIADVDGDGQMELIVKEISDDNNAGYEGPDFDRIEVYKLDGRLLWWIDCGANLADFQHNETNIAAYDWDEDGKAECIMRAADGTTIHTADGKTYVIGDPAKKYRKNAVGSQWFVHEGAEYLIYLNGETGTPYNIGPSDHPTYMDYPLKRLENGETDLARAWGDGYGHRSSKYFFGAPYFDGRNPSIFLARGIYTRHKMIALDVDKSTHRLTTRWSWNCNDSSSPWYGQGYHNYAVADVDCDGRDEIVFGSMVIDDNGKGLSTTGLGHGDAEHVGDYNPYIHGLEIYACNETHPSNNYRDATTSKIYYRKTGGADDGRSMMANFTNSIPGAIGSSAHDTPISAVTNDHITNMTKVPGLNFRIYWDGDLLDESLNYSNGKNTAFLVSKYDGNASWLLDGSVSNNDTKGTPCFQGDIFGDWREEVVARTSDGKIRIYTTTIPTDYRIPTLLSDKQYRNAMVWQMNGYNQPPAVSYYLGELEGITVAPPSETNRGREEVANGGSISQSFDGKQVMMAETNDMTVSVSDGAAPSVFFDNAPTWVQGHDDNDNITTETYTHTLTGGAFGGSMRLVKQGDGVLVLPSVEQKYTGNTDIWAGTVKFDGTLNSPLWLNRHTTLVTDGGNFKRGIKADYGSNIIIGGNGAKGTLTTDTLALGFGSVLNLKIFSDGSSDQVSAKVLTLEKKDWQYGPTYNAPVLNITAVGGTATPGTYTIATVDKVVGNLDDVTLTGLSGVKARLEYSGKDLNLVIPQMRSASAVEWTGTDDGTWDFADKLNFKDNAGESDIFVTGDDVTFNDNASSLDVTVKGNVAPKSITFDNTKTYSLDGDSIIGAPALVKKGSGEVIINNVNHIGSTAINDGKLTVACLANNVGQDCGSLGGVDNTITINNGATLKISADATVGQRVSVSGEGTIENPTSVTMSRGILGGGTLTKKGNGTLGLASGNNLRKLIVSGGTVSAANASLPATVELDNGTTLEDNTSNYGSLASSFVVPENAKATLTMAPYATYTGKLTGKGQLTVTATGVRCALRGDWSQFEGVIVAGMGKRGAYAAGSLPIDNDYGMPLATLNVPEGVSVSNNYEKGGKHDVEVGSYTGTGTLTGTGRWILGANGKTFIFGLNSTSTLVKRGGGVMRVISFGKLDCPLYVEDGCLAWNDSRRSTQLFGSHPLYVQGSGNVVANGLVQSVVMSGNSQLTPSTSTYSTDSPTSAGTFATTASFGASDNAVVNFLITRNGVNSKLQVGTSLGLSKIKVILGSGYKAAKGDEFTLWTCGSLRQSPISIELPELPEGLYWDTSALTDGSNTGVLKVTDTSTGIKGVVMDAHDNGDIYTIDGKKVDDTTKPGVYIINGKKVVVK